MKMINTYISIKKMRKSGLKVIKRYLQDVKRYAIIIEKM